MITDDPHTDVTDPADVSIGALQTSLFRLMTLYSVMPCLGKARTIVRLLSALTQHPELKGSPMQQDIYLQMLDTWHQLAHDTATVRCVGKAQASAPFH